MILIGTDDGIYRWYDGIPWPIYHALQGRSIRLLAAAGSGIMAAVDASGRVRETVDNGLSWREVPRPEGSGRPTALALAPGAGLVMATARPLGLFRRPLGAPIGSGGGALDRILVRARALGSLGNGRGGASAVAAPPAARGPERHGWTPLAAPEAGTAGAGPAPEIRALAVDPASPTHWYAAVSGAGLWASEDSGASWEPRPGLPAEVYAIRADAAGAGRLAVGTADGVHFSGDGGRTWDDRNAGLEGARMVRALERKPGAPEILLAGAAPRPGDQARDGLGFALYETADGGKAWAHVKRGAPEDLVDDPIVDIRFDPAAPRNILVAAESGEMWISRNGGEYWSPLARQLGGARALAATT